MKSVKSFTFSSDSTKYVMSDLTVNAFITVQLSNLKAATCIVTETDTKEEAKHFYQPLLGDKVHRKWDATDAFWPFKPQWHLKAWITCNKIYVVVRNSEVWRDLISVLIQSNTSLCFCSTNSGVFPHQLICQQTDGCRKPCQSFTKLNIYFMMSMCFTLQTVLIYQIKFESPKIEESE